MSSLSITSRDSASGRIRSTTSSKKSASLWWCEIRWSTSSIVIKSASAPAPLREIGMKTFDSERTSSAYPACSISSGRSGSSATPTTKISFERRRKLTGCSASTAWITTRTFGPMLTSRRRSRFTGWPRAARAAERPSRNQRVSSPLDPSTTAIPPASAARRGSTLAIASLRFIAALRRWLDDQLEALDADHPDRRPGMDLAGSAASRPSLAASICDPCRREEGLGRAACADQRIDRQRRALPATHLQQAAQQDEEVHQRYDDGAQNQHRMHADLHRIGPIDPGVQ